jgi:glycosyltransferase involved in cell wall biosynthesis
MNVSVVIPCFNRANTIKRAIDSVMAQVEFNGEIVVVDDGSTDETKEIIQEYGKEVRYFYKENGGVSSARNLGVKNALCDYVAFLDADDYWFDEKIKAQTNYMQANSSLKWCATNFTNEYGESNVINKSALKTLSKFECFNKYLDIAIWNVPHQTSGILVQKELLHKAGLFDERLRIAQDINLWFRIGFIEPKVGYLKDPQYVYSIDVPDSQVKSLNRLFYAINSLSSANTILQESDDIDDEVKLLFGRYLKNFLFRGLIHYYEGSQNLSRDMIEGSINNIGLTLIQRATLAFFKIMPLIIRNKSGGYLRDINRRLLAEMHRSE